MKLISARRLLKYCNVFKAALLHVPCTMYDLSSMLSLILNLPNFHVWHFSYVCCISQAMVWQSLTIPIWLSGFINIERHDITNTITHKEAI